MLISEIYQSIQGEGSLTGQESVFVRTSGCNLRCSFCDTPYTSWNPEGDNLSIEAILERVTDFAGTHVVITGGEPMIASQMPALTSQLRALGQHITIETAGTVFQSVDCDLMSISPKLSNSVPSMERAGQWRGRHDRRRVNYDTVSKLMANHAYQLKFVVSDPEDMVEIIDFCNRLGGVQCDRVLLMPEGTDPEVLRRREGWVRQLCHDHGFTFCPRMHIVWFGNRRGT